ncbi:uncharacterized protein isoform X1 [Musca autumnalis]|uniref:uncharacterized protein isoform X1 n=1 Tax=Musca autumnalis TaxID=221902 RepID=UPI003CFA7223
MERRYKKAKLNNSLTGRNKMTCPFEMELDNLFGEKKSINPEYVLDNENVEGKAGISVNMNENSDDSDTPSSPKKVSSEKKCIEKCNPKQKALQVLQEIAEEKKNFHLGVLKHLEDKEKKADRKLELLEKLASHFCNNNNST